MAEAQLPTVANSEAVVMPTTEVNSEAVVTLITGVNSEAVELKVVEVTLITEVSTVAVAEEKLEWKETNALVKEAA